MLAQDTLPPDKQGKVRGRESRKLVDWGTMSCGRPVYEALK